MNGFALRKKGIRSKGSIIREMVLHGFSNKEIVELCPAELQYVKTIVAKVRGEAIFNYQKQTSEMRLYLKQNKSAMFSENEMDYGTTMSSKYTWQSLNPNERELIKHRNHKELCKLK